MWKKVSEYKYLIVSNHSRHWLPWALPLDPTRGTYSAPPDIYLQVHEQTALHPPKVWNQFVNIYSIHNR